MKNKIVMSVLALLAIALVTTTITVSAQELHREKSLYRNIVVKQDGDRRCLVFAVKRGDQHQTSMSTRDPKLLVFPYVRMTLAGLLLNPKPKRVLMIGLGGGSMPTAITELVPTAHLDVVEIDDAVVRVARRFFDYKDTMRMRTYVSDGRVFVKRAALRKNSYDMIFLDAFTGDYIPEHMMTFEFLEEMKQILNEDGVLVANTFSTSALYDYESMTYEAVFGEFFNFKMPITANRVVIATRSGKLPEPEALKETATSLAPDLRAYGVDITTYPTFLETKVDWQTRNRRILTDQYSPANLLQGR